MTDDGRRKDGAERMHSPLFSREFSEIVLAGQVNRGSSYRSRRYGWKRPNHAPRSCCRVPVDNVTQPPASYKRLWMANDVSSWHSGVGKGFHAATRSREKVACTAADPAFASPGPAQSPLSVLQSEHPCRTRHLIFYLNVNWTLLLVGSGSQPASIK